MALKRISDLQSSTALVGDELVELSQVSTTVTITSTAISALAVDNSFNDSAAGFLAAGFSVGDRVRVIGFSTAANNLVAGTITALTADKLTIGGVEGDAIVNESSGQSVTISKWTSVKALLSEIGIGGSSLPTYGAGDAGKHLAVNPAENGLLWETPSGGSGGGGGDTVGFRYSRATSDQSISAATGTTLIFNNEVYDTLPGYDSSTGIWTVPPEYDGNFVVLTGEFWSSSYIQENIDLSIIGGGQTLANSRVQSTHSVSVATAHRVSSGETYYLSVYTDTSSSLGTNTRSHFSVTIVQGAASDMVFATMETVVARYWMLTHISAYQGYVAPAMSGLEFRPTVGGTRMTGTIDVSSEFSGSYLISNAFNSDNTASLWSAHGSDSRPWVMIDLGVGNESQLHEVMIRARTDGYNYTTPASFDLMYSDDGLIWHNLGRVSNHSADPSSGEVRTYDVSNMTKKLKPELNPPYDLGFEFDTTPTADEVVGKKLVSRNLELPANLVGSVGNAGTNPSASFVLSLKDDGVEIATITISTGGVFTFATTSGTFKAVDSGSLLTLEAPSTPDASVADVVMTILASVT